MSYSEKIERLERQTELFQWQIKALQAEITQTKKMTVKVEAVQPGSARQRVAAVRPIRLCLKRGRY